ncbi:MAG: hypothetical protein JWM27_4805 [Gemmatimonadetes bacterium]|nr:hypothetical protein [Gemmatimonadota bacterium]
MPTIYREDGFEVVIFTRDEHPPPHVHVFHAGELIVIELEPMAVRESRMKRKNAGKAWLLVAGNREAFLRQWHHIWSLKHG